LLSDEPVTTSQPLRWSPDGKWIAYSEYFLDPESGHLLPAPVSSGLKAIAVEGGRRIKLSGRENKIEGRENAVVGGFAWSPDGQKLAYAWIDDPLYFYKFHITIANADGSDPKNISYSEEAFPPSDLAWSPDGSLLVFIWSDENGPGALVVYDYLEDEIVNNVQIHTSEVSRLSWSPTGMQFLFALNWDTAEGPSHWISAALLEENAKVFLPPSRLSVVEIIDLEGSDASTGENAFPQWQPRP
jgi:Tol biopolymer transport system component